ncbi:LysR substrate-binding domain-containing protein [Salidesulfovibrio brasiliensis]
MLALETLRTFVAAAESGSFTRAGALVNRTQAAVSMQMKRLEEETGRPLFVREGRSIRLAPGGEVLLPYARRLIRLHDEAVFSLAEPDVSGRARLGAPEDFASIMLPGVLERFARVYPHVVVDVRCEATEQLMAALGRGELDLTLCTTPEEPGTGVIVRREPVVWAASKRHDTHLARPLPLALFTEGCAYRRWATQALEASAIAYRVGFESPSVSGVLAAVRSGLAVAPVGASMVPDDIRVLGPAEGFPSLPAAVISVQTARADPSEVVRTLKQEVVRAFGCREATD